MRRNMPALPPLPRPKLVPAAPEHIYWEFKPEADAPSGTCHIHWGITAFSKWSDEGNMVDSVSVEVEALNEEDAIARAMVLIVRPNYRVSWVKEACSKDKEVNG